MYFKSKFSFLLLFSILRIASYAQKQIGEKDFSSFKSQPSNWSIVSDVNINSSNNTLFNVVKGQGILINQLVDGKGEDLISNFEHNDLELEFEFMLTKNSNSGVYLMGNYELQLADSWGKSKITFADCGGIYERWDESKPESQKGYEGIKPRENASKAPGLWQKVKLSFSAPEFVSGKKTTNAVIKYVYLNGALIHENVQLTGVTRGALSEERPAGPLRFQGDHGSVAFRNIFYQSFTKKFLNWKQPLNFKIYESIKNEKIDLSKLKVVETGKIDKLSKDIIIQDNNFAIEYEGIIDTPEQGEYTLDLLKNGATKIIVNDQEIVKFQKSFIWDGPFKTKINLVKGENKLKIYYLKTDQWANASIGVFIYGNGYSKSILHDANSLVTDPKTPAINLNPTDKIIVNRSFVNDKFGKKTTHAASIGFPGGINLSINPEKLSLIQLWKGSFLEMNNAWEGRGGESVLPAGGAVIMAKNIPTVAFLDSQNQTWPDSLQLDNKGEFKFLNYKILANAVSFNFKYKNLTIEEIYSAENGNSILTKTINIKGDGNVANAYLLFESASQILDQKDGNYIIGDKEYFLKLKDAKSIAPTIRTQSNSKELIVPIKLVNGSFSVSYSYIW